MKRETDCSWGFWKFIGLTFFLKFSFLSITFDTMLGGQICLIWGSDFEFASYFFAYAKFEKGCVIELAILLRFSKTRELWSSKANWHLRFSLPSIILVDLSGNRTLLQRVQRSWFVICDCWISIRFVCFCVSRFVACDRNYDRRQRKTQLWRRLLSFRVRVFVKSAVTKWTRQRWHSPVYVWLLWFWPVLYLVWLFLLFLFPGFG